MNCRTAINRRRCGALGFTLMELMVVVVMIGIMTALIIPEMKGTYEDALLRSTGRKLVSVIQLANSRAITRSQIQRVRIDSREGRVSIEGGSAKGQANNANNDLPGNDGRLDSRITVEVKQAGEEPSQAPDAATSFVSGDDLGKRGQEQTITLYPDGTADAVDVVLRDREGFRLGLRINPVTARVQSIELQRQ